MTDRVSGSGEMPAFPLPYPNGFNPSAEHKPWQRAQVLCEHLGLRLADPRANVMMIARVAQVFTDYETLDKAARLATVMERAAEPA